MAGLESSETLVAAVVPHVVFAAYPGFTALDLVGPHEVLARTPATCSIAAARLAPVSSDRGLTLMPHLAFADCSEVDVLVVPGGPGQTAAMEDAELLAFLRSSAQRASIVAGVCTGVLLLAAAGPARGRRASTHWLATEELARLGGVPTGERLTRDGTLYTCAGVSAGIDLAIVLARDLFGAEEARRITLAMEYDPTPPFDVGSVRKASPSLIEALRATSRFHGAGRSAGCV